MESSEHITSAGIEDFDLSTQARVRLPFMAPKLGNAWAQRQELERQRSISASHSASNSQDQASANTDNMVHNNPIHSEDTVTASEKIPTTPQTSKASKGSKGSKSSMEIPAELALPMPKQRNRVQPVIPLISSGREQDVAVGREGSNLRAATDPVKHDVSHPSAIPKPLFAEKTEKRGNVASLKSKFSKGKKDANKIPPTTSDKARDILGYKYPVKDNTGIQPPASAPASSFTPEPFRTSVDSDTNSSSPVRAIRSTPGPPTTRFLYKNSPSKHKDSPALSHSTTETLQTSYATPKPKVQAMILGDPSLSPTRQGTYAKTGNVGFVRTQPSVASMTGAFEIVSRNSSAGQASMYSGPLLTPTVYDPNSFNRNVTRRASQDSLAYPQQAHYRQQGGQAGQGQLYSPSVYGIAGGGAWEQLQHQYPQSMPQFSPMLPMPHRLSSASESQYTETSSETGNSRIVSGVTVISSGSRDPDFANFSNTSLPYKNNHNSTTPTAATSGENNNTTYGNSAPTPPHPGYQARGSSDDYLAHQCAALHQHLEREVGRLSAQIEDAKNMILDELIRRMDATSMQISNVAKEAVTARMQSENVRGQLGGVQRDLREEVNRVLRNVDSLKDTVKREVGIAITGLRANAATLQVLKGRMDPLSAVGTAAGEGLRDENATPTVAGLQLRVFSEGSVAGGGNEPERLSTPSVPTPTKAFPTPLAHSAGSTGTSINVKNTDNANDSPSKNAGGGGTRKRSNTALKISAGDANNKGKNEQATPSPKKKGGKKSGHHRQNQNPDQQNSNPNLQGQGQQTPHRNNQSGQHHYGYSTNQRQDQGGRLDDRDYLAHRNDPKLSQDVRNDPTFRGTDRLQHHHHQQQQQFHYDGPSSQQITMSPESMYGMQQFPGAPLHMPPMPMGGPAYSDLPPVPSLPSYKSFSSADEGSPTAAMFPQGPGSGGFGAGFAPGHPMPTGNSGGEVFWQAPTLTGGRWFYENAHRPSSGGQQQGGSGGAGVGGGGVGGQGQ